MTQYMNEKGLFVAEVGGYLGMVLGVSLMDLEIIAKIFMSSLKNMYFKNI